mgnify:CR=1 FL=1
MRDLLLRREVHDLDFSIIGNARIAGKRLADQMGGGFFLLDDERNTARVLLSSGGEKITIDIAEIRADSLENDLRGRDFTINAMCLDLDAPTNLIDPLKGALDLKEKIIRTCSETSFESDPVRVLRAVRMALSLNARILPETLSKMRQAVPSLHRSAMERHRDEFFRMLAAPRVRSALSLLDSIGVLTFLFPEITALKDTPQSEPHIMDVWGHTLAAVEALETLLGILLDDHRAEQAENLVFGSAKIKLLAYKQQLRETLNTPLVSDRPKRALLMFAALFHDAAKPHTLSRTDDRIHFFEHESRGLEIVGEVARRLTLGQAEIDYISKIVKNHMRIHTLASNEAPPSRRAVYRFFRDTGEAGVGVCLLSLADTRATYGIHLPMTVWEAELEICRLLLDTWYENYEERVNPITLINGRDVMEIFKLEPGPLIGKILSALHEAQAVGTVADREAAISFVRAYLAEPGNWDEEV